MSNANEARLLVALQDLDQMIIEAEDEKNREALEAMGFPVTGLEDLRAARAKLAEQIPRALQTRYERLNDRAGRAVVPVVENTCTGCFTNIPTSFTSSVNADRIMYCETCGRMLFWPNP